MTARRLSPGLSNRAAVLAAGVTVPVLAFIAVTSGSTLALGPLAGLVLMAVLSVGFARWPHVTVAAVVAFLIVLPTLKLFVFPQIGIAKEAITLAAVTGVAIARLGVADREELPQADRWLLGSTGLLVAVYLLNPAGPKDLAWFHGTRLVVVPLILLCVGLLLPDPRRTLRWAVGALIATACAVAMFGLVQQWLGVPRLVELGYPYGRVVREIDGSLRSFGTLDEPFAYAAVLLLAFALLVAYFRPQPMTAAIGVLLVAGVAASLVRTAALILAAVAGLWLLRRGRPQFAAATLLVVAIVGTLLLLSPSQARTARTLEGPPGVSTILNGRADAWSVVLGDPSRWAFGLGVGEVGTGAERASESLLGGDEGEAPSLAVDSGYIATIADVGIVGLMVLLAILGRAALLARKSIRATGSAYGWVAVSILVVLLLDALTRSSFTAFPNAYIGMLLLGLALAAAGQEARAAEASA